MSVWPRCWLVASSQGLISVPGRLAGVLRQPIAMRGATLISMVFVLAIAAVILGAAIAFGSQWIGHARTSTSAMTALVQRDALRTAARSWFTGRYCQPDRRAGVVQTPAPEIELGVEELRGHLQGGVLPMETATLAMSWRIRIARTGIAPPRLHLLWLPPRGDMREALARQTGAYCDADDDPVSAEPCVDSNSNTRLVWSELLVKPTSRVSRARQLSDWIRIHGIPCDITGPDLDGDGVGDPDGRLDKRCDWDGDGRFGPYLARNGRDDTGHFDADGDGLLDLDIAGGPTGGRDLAVDVHDWHALGC